MTHLSRFDPKLSEDYLKNTPESKFLERKGRNTKHTKIANELIGMLNAGGGVLVYGIADDGTVESLAETDLLKDASIDLENYRKIVHDLIKPPANIEIEEVYFSDGSLVFIYHVEPNFEGVYQRKDNEDVYLRVADSNKGPLKRDEVAKLEYNRGIRNYEEEIVPDFNEDDLDLKLCSDYVQEMNYEGSFQELAHKRKLLTKKDGQYLYKNAAVLLFANDPDTYIRNAHVRYVRYEGTQQLPGGAFNAEKEQRFEGAIPKLIVEISSFLEAVLRDYFFLDLSSGRFLKVPEYPKEAWLEGIVNALYHRSYNIQGRPVLIKHYEDRIEISNSGPLPAQVTPENIRSEQYTRNVRIARTLNDLGYVNELNEGVDRIYQVMEDLKLDSPEYKQQNGYVYLTLRNRIAKHKKSITAEVMNLIENGWQSFSNTQHEVIRVLMFNNPEASLDDFIQQIDVSEQAIRKNLNGLEKMGLIEKMTIKKRDRNAPYRFNPS